MNTQAVFLDRDGTLIVDHGYTRDPLQVELLPGVIPALSALQTAGYQLIIISNQSGIGRQYLSFDDVDKVNQRLERLLNERGIQIREFYYCPHKPDEQCKCRKPEPGMILQAISDYNIDPSQSYLVGDKWTDVLAAIAAGVKPVWLTQESVDLNNFTKSVTVTNSLLSWTELMELEVL